MVVEMGFVAFKNITVIVLVILVKNITYVI